MKSIQESFYFNETEFCFVVIEDNGNKRSRKEFPFHVIFRFKNGWWDGEVTEEFVKDLHAVLAEVKEKV